MFYKNIFARSYNSFFVLTNVFFHKRIKAK